MNLFSFKYLAGVAIVFPLDCVQAPHFVIQHEKNMKALTGAQHYSVSSVWERPCPDGVTKVQQRS